MASGLSVTFFRRLHSVTFPPTTLTRMAAGSQSKVTGRARSDYHDSPRVLITGSLGQLGIGLAKIMRSVSRRIWVVAASMDSQKMFSKLDKENLVTSKLLVKVSIMTSKFIAKL